LLCKPRVEANIRTILVDNVEAEAEKNDEPQVATCCPTRILLHQPLLSSALRSDVAMPVQAL
jgi:hypothetical protein